MSVVLESMKDDVFTITLNRPDKKNAMDYDLLAGGGLLDLLERAIRVVLVQGLVAEGRGRRRLLE